MPPLRAFISLVVVSPPALFFCLLAPALLQPGAPLSPRGGSPHRDGRLEGLLADEEAAGGADLALLQRASGRAGAAAAPASAPGRAPGDLPLRFIRNRDVLDELPLAHPLLPEHLREVFWLDQWSAYGSSDIPQDMSFSDLCVSLGGPDMSFDPVTRIMIVPATGTSWQWMNNPKSYRFLKFALWSNAGYKFYWNEDYTRAEAFMQWDFPFLGEVVAPKNVINFELEIQRPPPGLCPPKPHATSAERSRCATVRRSSKILQVFPPVSAAIGVWDYYAFSIGDSKHRKIQPYFDAYLEFADRTSQPDTEYFASVYQGNLTAAGGTRHGMSIISKQIR